VKWGHYSPWPHIRCIDKPNPGCYCYCFVPLFSFSVVTPKQVKKEARAAGRNRSPAAIASTSLGVTALTVCINHASGDVRCTRAPPCDMCVTLGVAMQQTVTHQSSKGQILIPLMMLYKCRPVTSSLALYRLYALTTLYTCICGVSQYCTIVR
jgi:hypothetical protein